MLSGRTRLALLIAASLLLTGSLCSSAFAKVTASQVTAPAGPILELVKQPLGAASGQTLSVSGTATTDDAFASDSVELGCFYTGVEGLQKETVLRKLNNEALIVPVSTVNGSFSTSEAALEGLWLNQPCTLRAVPPATLETASVAAFTGPSLGDAGIRTEGVEANKLTDEHLATATLQGVWSWNSSGHCGLSGHVFENEAAGFRSTLPEVAACEARVSAESQSGGAASIVVDGHNGYDVYAAREIGPGPGTEGQPFLKPEAPSLDPSTGNLSQIVTEEIVRCETAAGAPVASAKPTGAECVKFAPTGVKLVRTVATGQSGLQATVTDSFESTDASTHAISLSYGEQQQGSVGTPSYRFPGEATFKSYSAGQTPPTGSSAPATIFFQADAEAASSESPHENPRGAITLSAVPTAVRYANTHTFELLYSNQTVPASGTLTFIQVLSQALTQPRVEELAGTAQAGLPTLSISSPSSGATVAGSSVQVSGNAKSGAEISSLTVNGVPVSIGGEGAWSANVALHLGANTITAVATDNAGKTASRSITVTYTPKSETTVTQTPAGNAPAVVVVTAPSPPAPARAHAAQFGKVSGAAGKVTYTLACLGVAGTHCNVTVMLSTIERLRGKTLLGVIARQQLHTKRILLASGTLSIPAGLRVNVSVRLDATGRKLLARFGKLPARLSTILSATAGGPAETVIAQNLTILPVKKAKKH